MGKIVFAALIGALIWIFFFLKPRKRRARDERQPPDAPSSSPSKSADSNRVESMVQCARCGVFMPESDSVRRDGKIGCAKPETCTHASAGRP